VNALPPAILEQRVTCSVAAAIRFHILANVLLAVAEIENGRPGLSVRNTNGTHDIGLLQFNTQYLAGLRKFGIQPADVAAATCYPFDLAAWRLAGHLARDRGDLWTRAANYHSRTPCYNAIYRGKLVKAAARWEIWLTEHVAVRVMTVHGSTAFTTIGTGHGR
jgi:hypothetical protein